MVSVQAVRPERWARPQPARWPATAPVSGSMALIGHDLPCRPARLPDSAGRRLRTAGPATATNDSLPASKPSSAGSGRSGAAAAPRRRGAVRRVPGAGCRVPVSESGQLGARRHDPHTARTKIHDQGGVNLDADDPAEAVRIVGNLIPHGELLSRRSGGWAGEGTSGQEAPGRGAGWLHHYQYAPAGSMRLPGALATGSAGLARLPADGSPGGGTALPASRRICASHKPGRPRRRGVAPAARDDRQVMRDKQVREAKATLKIKHQVENPRPHGHGAPGTVHAPGHRLPARQYPQSWLPPARRQRFSAALSPYAYHLRITHVRSSPKPPRRRS
jgi:hypothetical protein